MSLLDILKRLKFDISSPIYFREIVVEMLANAWYPHNYFKLSFGKQDQIAKYLDLLVFEIDEPILRFTDTDKTILREKINQQNLNEIVNFVSRYVPYRLIRPFFEKETKGLKDYDVNSAIINLSNFLFNDKEPLYRFYSQNEKSYDAIILNPTWTQYLLENYIIRGWVSWNWLNYMQDKNSNVPNIVNKIFMPQQRDSLISQTKYWKIILEHQAIKCIYSKVPLCSNQFSLDHYLPWSFVAHDQLWNLIPTTKLVNSSKSNNLPSNQYLDNLVKLQHLGLKTYLKYVSRQKWLNDVEGFVLDLKVSQADDLLDLNIIMKAYEATIKPLISLATIQGFSSEWTYS